MADEIFFSGSKQYEPSTSSDTLQGLSLTGSVLVAADNQKHQQLIISYVNQIGINAVVADHGLDAVHKALAGKYELLILDMQCQ